MSFPKFTSGGDVQNKSDIKFVVLHLVLPPPTTQRGQSDSPSISNNIPRDDGPIMISTGVYLANGAQEILHR